MNTNKTLALPAIAVMAATLLAGCGHTKSSSSPDPTMSHDAMMTEGAMASESAMTSDPTMSHDAMTPAPTMSHDAMMTDGAQWRQTMR